MGGDKRLMKDDNIIGKKTLVSDLKKKVMKDDDLISRSALLSDLRKQIPDVDISLYIEIIENQPPADNIKFGEVLLSDEPDKEHLINTIVFILMMGITMLLSAFLLR